MVQLAVVIETTDIEQTADRLFAIGVGRLDRAAQSAVNEVTDRTFDDSVKRMTARVNLTPDRVKKDMGVEYGSMPGKAEATIIAFRDRGRRRVNPVNLRQYNARQLATVNNWSNSGVATNSGIRLPIDGPLANPRKAGSYLPFKKRIGASRLGIPVGQKQDGITIEVLKGSVKPITYAFMAMSRNNGMLVFKREKGDSKGKGKLVSMHSLSVWQLFRKTSAEIVPLVREDLSKTVLANVDAEMKDVL